MKLLIGCLIAATAACGTPGHGALAQTPTATTKRTPGEAPAANDTDAEREQLIHSTEQQRDAESAYIEAGNGSGAERTPAAKPATHSPAGGVQPKTTPVSPDKQPRK